MTTPLLFYQGAEIMITIWWPAFIVPVLMVVSGILRFPKYRSRQKLSEKQQQFADALAWKMRWQFGLVFAALAFMLMRSVLRMAAGTQQMIVYVVIVLQAVGFLLIALPVEQALQENSDDMA